MKAPARTDKPWGYELLLAHTDKYAGKILFVRKGESLSLQYHERKHETLYLHSGEAEVTVGATPDDLRKHTIRAGTSLTLPPLTVHRLRALSDCTFFEVSTPELDDVVRLEDNYGRAGSK